MLPLGGCRPTSAVGLAGRLHCDARTRVVPQNSLRDLRSLRSDSCGKSDHEARSRAPTPALRFSSPQKSPPAGSACREITPAAVLRPNTTSGSAKARPGRRRRASEAPRSAGLVAARAARIVFLTRRGCLNAARRERSEFGDGATRPSIAGESAQPTAAAKRRGLPLNSLRRHRKAAMPSGHRRRSNSNIGSAARTRRPACAGAPAPRRPGRASAGSARGRRRAPAPRRRSRAPAPCAGRARTRSSASRSAPPPSRWPPARPRRAVDAHRAAARPGRPAPRCTARDLFFSTNWKCVSSRRFLLTAGRSGRGTGSGTARSARTACGRTARRPRRCARSSAACSSSFSARS